MQTVGDGWRGVRKAEHTDVWAITEAAITSPETGILTGS